MLCDVSEDEGVFEFRFEDFKGYDEGQVGEGVWVFCGIYVSEYSVDR